jgi:acetyl esterase/lipase
VADALADARRAVRLVRLHAAEWNIDPSRVGMVGSSAGAHLVLNLATHWDRGDPGAAALVERQSCRPDFIGLLCPWPNNQPVSDFPITRETPPAFVASARDDKVAPAAFAEGIAAAYARAGVKHRLWLLERGGHTAFKLGANRGEGARWPDQISAWLAKDVMAGPASPVR